MDWNTLYFSKKCCCYYGIPFQLGKTVKNSSSYGQPQVLCRDFGNNVAFGYTTAYYKLAIFETAARALAEENPIRATDRTLKFGKDSV
jgi:hypothetical protein